MKISLLILTGKHKGKSLTIPEKKLVIGRDPQADIRVNSTEVSRLHCEIFLQEERVIIKDLGSRNGTFINGDAIFSETELYSGDTLHVGGMSFELQGGRKKPATDPEIKPVKVPAGRKSKTASEADVIDWLSEEEFSDADTTIVTNKEAEKMHLPDISTITPRSQSIDIKPLHPGTQAAEAAEIIKKFWAKK